MEKNMQTVSTAIGKTMMSIYHEGGKWHLLLASLDITDSFIERVKMGDVELAFVEKGGCLFFVADVAGMGWITMPYAPQTGNYCWNGNDGKVLSIEVLDTASRKIVLEREETLELEYADRLRDICRKLEQGTPLNLESYRAKAKKVMRKIPSGNKMANEALLKNILYIYACA